MRMFLSAFRGFALVTTKDAEAERDFSSNKGVGIIHKVL